MRYYDAITRVQYRPQPGSGYFDGCRSQSRFLGDKILSGLICTLNLVNIFGSIPLKLNPPLTQADINVS